jgi:inhibitor of KinA sporulation pathway (predicted exonuclease)
MLFLSLDLEFNQPSRKIIQVGVCVGDFERGLIVSEERIYVNPNEIVSPYITTLTGIKQEQVNKGLTLAEAFEKVVRLHSKYNCFVNPLTWGGDDTQELKTQLEQAGLPQPNWPFGFRSIDVKTLYFGYALARKITLQSGLENSMRRVGLTFYGRKHDALDDAKNTFILARHLVKNSTLAVG